MDALLKLVDRKLQRGHIEPSTSPWNTPVFVIPKRTGEGFRLLHDLREVNKTIQPMGPVQTLLPMNSMIPEGQPCAVLDIKDCFFLIPLHDEDKERFAFSVVFPNSQRPNLRFQWKVLPQGMINSPTICQITVDRALAPVRCSDPTMTIIQYMDNILIAAPSVQQLEATAMVLACGLFPMEHLNIVTDSLFVAKLCLAMTGPGVSTTMAALMLEEVFFSRKGTISVIHVNSHDPIKGFYQIGNDKADAAAKGERIICCPCSPYAPVTDDVNKSASVLSEPENSAREESRQQQSGLCGGKLRYLRLILILGFVATDEFDE
ncbi:endogenous retrovirus group K member 11 Pol protein-like [Patagioenas fasciata monilis]|uniref:ribonuclease H n=1 Tax=Patagioenas fasciata monilis TaxID=372326 RepID=A0A1V4JM40_PATFA|nr:endogenous retrovirus group K member 11 Pol protein-like [Patagioenas fasciata monilis]